MSKVKNQYLLAAVVVLSILSAILCFVLVISESSNGSQLVKLQGDLSRYREDQNHANKQLTEKIDEITGAMNQLNSQLGGSVKVIHADLESAKKVLDGVQGNLKGMISQLASATKRLDAVEKNEGTKDRLDHLQMLIEKVANELTEVKESLKKKR